MHLLLLLLLVLLLLLLVDKQCWRSNVDEGVEVEDGTEEDGAFVQNAVLEFSSAVDAHATAAVGGDVFDLASSKLDTYEGSVAGGDVGKDCDCCSTTVDCGASSMAAFKLFRLYNK
ncbi:hypothetical protein T4D_10914 [Trichinella pseudospiralis]|uniref:Uncharacterized protein n=1 Tax=Trichinella pseudospiralis TaxID=6337 RepID=A0A0V1G2R2_TRIPS|nr:hypothetical protein T4D_10914 [Trichinella pseudospiralis]